MASCDNFYDNIAYSTLSERESKLIMDITMSGTSIKGIMTQKII